MGRQFADFCMPLGQLLLERLQLGKQLRKVLEQLTLCPVQHWTVSKIVWFLKIGIALPQRVWTPTRFLCSDLIVIRIIGITRMTRIS